MKHKQSVGCNADNRKNLSELSLKYLRTLRFLFASNEPDQPASGGECNPSEHGVVPDCTGSHSVAPHGELVLEFSTIKVIYEDLRKITNKP